MLYDSLIYYAMQVADHINQQETIKDVDSNRFPEVYCLKMRALTLKEVKNTIASQGSSLISSPYVEIITGAQRNCVPIDTENIFIDRSAK